MVLAAVALWAKERPLQSLRHAIVSVEAAVEAIAVHDSWTHLSRALMVWP